jgi:hypothetical protein
MTPAIFPYTQLRMAERGYCCIKLVFQFSSWESCIALPTIPVARSRKPLPSNCVRSFVRMASVSLLDTIPRVRRQPAPRCWIASLMRRNHFGRLRVASENNSDGSLSGQQPWPGLAAALKPPRRCQSRPRGTAPQRSLHKLVLEAENGNDCPQPLPLD